MSSYLEKPNRNENEFQSPLDSLLTFLGARPMRFESTASVSLDACIERLNAMEEKPGWTGYLLNQRTITVEIHRIDDANCQFEAVKKKGRYLPVRVRGHMEHLSNSSTLITGEAQSKYLLWQIVIPLTAFLFFFLLLGLIREIPFPLNVFFGVWAVFIGGITIIASAYDRASFVDYVVDTLNNQESSGKQKRKRS